MQKAFLFIGILLVAMLARPNANAKVGALDDMKSSNLLKLPSDSAKYKVHPYLKGARSLQAVGKERAFTLLRELAAKDNELPHYRTIVLCRMLFKAKPSSQFRRPYVGGPSLIGRTKMTDWPLEPVAIVDGIPFLVARGYMLSGRAGRPSEYVEYCIRNCDWNDFEFKLADDETLRKALKKLLSSPPLNGRVNNWDRTFVEAQIAD